MHFPSPQELKNTLPLTESLRDFVTTSRTTLQKIFDRHDRRLVLIVGPCSIHDLDEALEYALLLKKVAEELQEYCFVIMRAYVEKPRTACGWKGLIHDPYLNESNEMIQGLFLARSLLLQLAKYQVPAATEFLTPHIAPYIEDLITWGCIGARTSASQVHRTLASYLPMPVGFKNTIDGNIDCALHGVFVAHQPNVFMHIDDEGRLKRIKSSGNSYSHVVLRGSLTHTNYNASYVQNTIHQLRCLELPPRLIIDCSHGNCLRTYYKQKEVFMDVLEQIRSGNEQILGLMLESYLEAGSQTIPHQLSDLQKGISITDPCLDFSSTKQMLYSIASGVLDSPSSIKLTHN